jgi:ABC-type uncharacterized transport system involved in gliding motility auxiliary subunit
MPSVSVNMRITSKSQRQLKLQGVLFYLLMIGLAIMLAQLSLKTDIHTDWTANNRHSLSATTKDFLKQLDTPITIQAFISPNSDFKPALTTLLNRYQTLSKQLNISYIDPDFSPDVVRKLNIQQQGEMVITLGEQQQHVIDLSEQSLTNALISVSREQDKWLIFIEGHGERKPDHQANFNLSTWAATLKQKGFKLKSINLVQHQQIPRNTAAVIIASPEKSWLPGEVDIIKDYLSEGGNLLWLTDPSENPPLLALAEYLGIQFVPGTLIDPNAELLGIADPQFTLITDYANHPITQATSSVTLFPKATAIEPVNVDSAWQYQALLTTPDNVWSDTQADLSPEFELGLDTQGPLDLAYLLTSKVELDDGSNHQQRIAVVGDGDFLSNSFIGNAANLELGLAMMNWLAEDDKLISIPVKTTLDNQLELNKMSSLLIGLGFLIIVPALLLLIGLTLWWYRRRQ